MKLKMKSAIKLYESFLKEGAEAPVATESTAVASREAVIKDVDAIITSLETLVSQVSEELEEEFNTPEKIEEAGDDNIIVQWITSMKAVKAQKKVNNIKVNKVALEIAKDEAPNAEQKEKIKQKETVLTNQIKSLQDAVNDRFANKGGLVDRKLANAKIEGELAVIKAHSGAGIDKQEAGDLKQRMADLQRRYKENEAALKELEPSEEDKKAAAEEAKKKKEAEAEAAEKAKKDQETADAAKAEQAKKDQEAADAEQAKKDQEAANEPKADDNADDETKKEREAKNSKEGKLKRLEDLLAKAKESGDEEKVKKVQDLIDKVSAKESWQLEGTELGALLEMEISKLEMEMTLNENRYFLGSVKDRFAKLI